MSGILSADEVAGDNVYETFALAGQPAAVRLLVAFEVPSLRRIAVRPIPGQHVTGDPGHCLQPGASASLGRRPKSISPTGANSTKGVIPGETSDCDTPAGDLPGADDVTQAR